MNNQTEVNDKKHAEGQSCLNDGLGAWINVNDRLPNLGQEVLAFRPEAHLSQDPHIVVREFTATARKSPQGVMHRFNCWCHVTHWIPLPQAPNVELRGDASRRPA